MSAFDIIGVVAAALQFSADIAKIVKYIDHNRKTGKDYHESLVDLHSKLRLFRTTLDSLKRVAEIIKSSKHRTEMESFALGPMNAEIKETEKTLKQLFTCQGEYQRPNDHSTLKLVVDYWVFNHRGKAIVKSGISEITDRMEAIKVIVNEVQTHVANDARDVAHETNNLLRQMTGDYPPCNRTQSNGSTEVTSYSDDETKTSFKHLASNWDMDLLVYEEVVAESSGLSAAVISAIEGKNYKIIAGLLRSGIDPLAKDDNGWCVFHYAVRAGSKTVMRELLDSEKVKDNKGFDLRDIHGDTALHFASFLGMDVMAKELLRAGCNKDAVNNNGHSPLFIAVNKKQFGIVDVLLGYKAECIPSNPDKLRKIRNDIKYLKSKAA